MAEHRRELGNKYIDMMVDMDMKDIKAKLAELREVTEGTEDQETLAMLRFSEDGGKEQREAQKEREKRRRRITDRRRW